MIERLPKAASRHGKKEVLSALDCQDNQTTNYFDSLILIQTSILLLRFEFKVGCVYYFPSFIWEYESFCCFHALDYNMEPMNFD